ncbi:MAG: hypothetical protein Q7T19_01140 [Caulobacter sp.]|nr:hypothetical protein [Caulobacter sp.]
MGEQALQDAVQFAAQTGRLDFLTAVLAVLALFIGISAFPLFNFLKARAEQVAREAVADVLRTAEEAIEKAAISKLEEMLPTLVEEYMKLAQNAVSAELGDQIAAAQEDGGGKE